MVAVAICVAVLHSLWWPWLPVVGTPSPHLGLDRVRQPASMGHRESKPEVGLSNEDIAFLLKNTNRSKKEIKVRPHTQAYVC